MSSHQLENFAGEVVIISLTGSTATIIYPLEVRGLTISRSQFVKQFIAVETKVN